MATPQHRRLANSGILVVQGTVASPAIVERLHAVAMVWNDGHRRSPEKVILARPERVSDALWFELDVCKLGFN